VSEVDLQRMRKAPTQQELANLTKGVEVTKNARKIVQQLTWDKFFRNKDLMEKLKATGKRPLFN
jgi:hypothetical protein